VPDGDESVCERCGLVVDEYRIDHGPDWREFDDSDGIARRAEMSNRNYSDNGLGSQRTCDSWNSDGRRQDRLNRRMMSEDKAARARGYLTSEVHRISCCLELPSHLRERAKYLARKTHEREGAKGKDLDTIAAASLLAAFREQQYGRTAWDISNHARTTEQDIQKRLLWVCDTMDIHPHPPDPERRIEIVANDLGLDLNTKRKALELYEDVKDEINSGTAPTTIAGMTCWVVSDVTQQDIKEKTGVTPTAIRGLRDRVGVGE